MPLTKGNPDKSPPNKGSGGRGQRVYRSAQSPAQNVNNPKPKTPANGGTAGNRKSPERRGHIGKTAQSPGTYVDNEKNRKLGRVGMPKGSMPETQGAAGSSNRTSNPKQESFSFSEAEKIGARKIDDKTYSGQSSSASDKGPQEDVDTGGASRSKTSVDNQERKRQGKVVKTHTDIDDCQTTGTSPTAGKEIKVYKDTPQNRRLNRVGLPVGTCVFSSVSKGIDQQTYKDTSENRKLQRVGLPRGCMPSQKKSSVTLKIPEMLKRIENGDEFKEFVCVDRSSSNGGLSIAYLDQTGARVLAYDEAMYRHNRNEEEKAWSTATKKAPKTQEALLENYKGKNIPFNEIKLYSVIGKGGFGVVYFAKLNDTVVAVKKLQIEKISNSRIKDFSEEIKKSCALKHPNIVKFIGACTEKLNLCIVMEYMQMTLFDALHVRNDTDFTEDEQIGIIQQVCEGMNYLHNKRIVHCDLKTSNILVDYVKNKICEVKITDFGLSMIIHDTSVSVEEMVKNIGTPRYSAPEMLRGEILSANDMKKADVYSLALIFLEVIFREEPFPDYSSIQLQRQVGERRCTPEIPDLPNIVQIIKDTMQQAWSYEPINRPSVVRIREIMHDIQFIYT